MRYEQNLATWRAHGGIEALDLSTITVLGICINYFYIQLPHNISHRTLHPQLRILLMGP